MFRLLQHGRKTEEVPVCRLVHHNFQLIFVHGGHLRFARHHHVAVFGGVAYPENALARRKSPDLNLRCQNARFIVVKKLEKRNVS
jgi:hypothetical protein